MRKLGEASEERRGTAQRQPRGHGHSRDPTRFAPFPRWSPSTRRNLADNTQMKANLLMSKQQSLFPSLYHPPRPRWWLLFLLLRGWGGVNPTLPHRRNPTDTHWDHSDTQKCTTGPRGDPRAQGLACAGTQDTACSHGAQLAPRRELTHRPGPGTQTHGGGREQSPGGDGGAHGRYRPQPQAGRGGRRAPV